MAQGQSASRRKVAKEQARGGCEKRMNIHGTKGVATLGPFYASLHAGNNHREVISILPGGVFASRRPYTLKGTLAGLEGRLASGNEFLFLLSHFFSSFFRPTLSLSLFTRTLSFFARQGYPIPNLPIFCTLSPVKFPLLKRASRSSPLFF